MSPSSAIKPTGLFGYSDLVSPEQLLQIAKIRIDQVNPLVFAVCDNVEKIKNGDENVESLKELRRAVKRLDLI
ncbi:hypothetical protein HK096_001129, partial [Nowakowskiella sp. JEL0078]